jgi:hypothetical protein
MHLKELQKLPTKWREILYYSHHYQMHSRFFYKQKAAVAKELICARKVLQKLKSPNSVMQVAAHALLITKTTPH